MNEISLDDIFAAFDSVCFDNDEICSVEKEYKIHGAKAALLLAESIEGKYWQCFTWNSKSKWRA